MIVALAIAGGAWFWYRNFEKANLPVSNAYLAVPPDAALIFETTKFIEMHELLHNSSQMWPQLLNVQWFQRHDSILVYLDSLFRRREDLATLLDASPLIVSGHKSGASSFDFVHYVSLPGVLQGGKMREIMMEICGKKVEISERNYESAIIYSLRTPFGPLHFSEMNGVFFLGFSTILMEDVVRKFGENVSILNTPGFLETKNTAGKNVQGNLFVNIPKFYAAVASWLNDEGEQQLARLRDFGDWIAMDLNLKPNAVMLNGFTFAADSSKNYLSVFKNQRPQTLLVPGILPANTAQLLLLALSNTEDFFNDYLAYLQNSGQLKARKDAIQKLNARCNCDVENLAKSWIGGEMAVAWGEPADVDSESDKFIVLRMNNRANAQKKLGLLMEAAGGEEMDQFREIPFRNLKLNNLYNVLLGDAFPKMKSPWFIELKDYIVFCESKLALRDFADAFLKDKTLAKNTHYTSFAENHLGDEANIFFYSGVARSANIYRKVLMPNWSAMAKKHDDILRQFYGTGYQISSSGENKYYSSMYLNHNPVYEKESGSLWQALLDTVITTRTYAVKNHYTADYEIFVQDAANQIHLLGTTGEKLWSRSLNAPMIGDVKQIDVFGNKKLQYLLNTRTHIYLIDRKGRDVPGFPILLESPATSPVVAFDYDNKADYRFLIGCEDNEVYNFDSEGESVAGWVFEGTESPVRKAPQHFQLKDKDYIFVFEEFGKVHVLDRRGQPRQEVNVRLKDASNNPIFIEPANQITKFQLVYSDKLGNIIKLQLVGNSEKIKLGDYNENHRFLYSNLDGDDRNEYLLLEKNVLSVFDDNQSKIFSMELDSATTHAPQVFSYKENQTLIGVVSNKTNQLFLVDAKGDAIEGSPFYGSTPFSLEDINGDGIQNLVTASKDRHVYVYTLR